MLLYEKRNKKLIFCPYCKKQINNIKDDMFVCPNCGIEVHMIFNNLKYLMRDDKSSSPSSSI